MNTPNVDKILPLMGDEITEAIKSAIKRKGAYKTGTLYNSIASTVKPITTGEEINVKMVEYGRYVNDGTKYIKARKFIELGLEQTKEEVFEQIAIAAAQDIADHIDVTYKAL